MAVPKRKQTRTRRDKRRTHQKAEMPTWSFCPQCSEGIRPHHVCNKCGYYKGKKVMSVKVS